MSPRVFLLIGFLFQLTIGLAQSDINTDSSVVVLPFWEKGESHSVRIKSSETNLVQGRSFHTMTIFNASFTVIENDTSGYLISWIYTRSELGRNDPSSANIDGPNVILAGLVNKEILVKLSLSGKFKELLNTSKLKDAASKVIDSLILRSEGNISIKNQLMAAKQMFSHDAIVEIALLPQIKFYTSSFGFEYKLNKVKVNQVKLVNPFGRDPFDAIENVQLKSLDNTGKTCVINRNKIGDEASVKKGIIAFLKDYAKEDAKTIEQTLHKKKIAFTENSMQQIDFSKGIVQKSKLTRKMNFGFQTRTIEFEIEAVE